MRVHSGGPGAGVLGRGGMCKFMARKGSRRKEGKKKRLFGELKKARDRRMVCGCRRRLA